MAETITCPVCGETNPAAAELCRNCKTPLKPAGAALPPGTRPIQPGQLPTNQADEAGAGLPRWLRDMREQAQQSVKTDGGKLEAPENPAPPAPADLLAGLESQKQQADDDTPEWVRKIAGKQAEPERPEPQMAKYVELSDEEEQTPGPASGPSLPPPEPPARPTERDELGDWFKQAAAATKPRREGPATGPRPAETAPLTTGSEDVPGWLKGLEAQAQADPTGSNWKTDLPLPSNAPPKTDTPATPALPEWLRNLGAESKSTEPPSNAEQLPSWLKSERRGEGSQAAPASAVKPPTPPDWVSSLRSTTGKAETTESPVAAKPESPASAPEPDTTAPAFSADALSTRDVDAIFASMQTPDWLVEATRGKSAGLESGPPAAQEQPIIAPAELPSWVQAMRPVESEMPVAPPVPTDARIEEGGPLDGLQGVLPAMPGAGTATSKPQALSEKLEASEQQRSNAELLEKMLAAEVTPIPMKAVPLMGSQRALRWAITAILVVILGAVVFSGSQIFAFPSAVPTESVQAADAIGSIPAGAPVLVVFDYQPATVGEMEASAASLLDHALLLQHPQLALISTSPTGAALAERFMSSVLADRKYQIGQQYVDLGYLPGGLAGIRAFAQSPATTMPLGADEGQVWNSAVLQQVRIFSDFKGIVLLTDSAESGRVWIEQTAGLRGSGPMVIVSSAQAGPMLLPYVDSGQVSGLVAGVYGAVGPEVRNGGLPGYVRRYWDAYNMGLYIAAFLIASGGLWNLWRRMQDQAAERAA